MRPRDAATGMLHRPQWERDVVYLVQFPTAPHCRTISPFALKLETWLRAAKIKYEPVYSLKFSTATGQIPYIELNGEEIAGTYQEASRVEQILTESCGSPICITSIQLLACIPRNLSHRNLEPDCMCICSAA